MNLSRRANNLIKNAALWASVAVAVLCIVLAGIGFLITGFFICLSRHTGEASAAAITGAALLVLAAVAGLAGGYLLKRIRHRQPSLMSELSGTVGMASRLVGFLVRKDPRKAMIISIVAGALAEYITSERKR
jgi:nitrate/nitrite transporter NarK